MASPKQVLMQAKMVHAKELPREDSCCDATAMKELVNRVFTTRNAMHFAHLASKSFAEHEALGYIYTAIVNKVDEIIECWQGKHGLLKGLSAGAATAPSDCCKHIKQEAEWLCDNREKISQGNDAVAALLDELEASYLKTIYKLENLA